MFAYVIYKKQLIDMNPRNICRFFVIPAILLYIDIMLLFKLNNTTISPICSIYYINMLKIRVIFALLCLYWFKCTICCAIFIF